MGKTSSKVKDRYNAKAYDEMKIRVPKGKKTLIDTYAKEHGESLNGLANALFRNALGMSEEEWKKIGDNDE